MGSGADRTLPTRAILEPSDQACVLHFGYERGHTPVEEPDEHEEPSALPRHLSALIGSLQGPEDLGRNHDKYLSYADRH